MPHPTPPQPPPPDRQEPLGRGDDALFVFLTVFFGAVVSALVVWALSVEPAAPGVMALPERIAQLIVAPKRPTEAPPEEPGPAVIPRGQARAPSARDAVQQDIVELLIQSRARGERGLRGPGLDDDEALYDALEELVGTPLPDRALGRFRRAPWQSGGPVDAEIDLKPGLFDGRGPPQAVITAVVAPLPHRPDRQVLTRVEKAAPVVAQKLVNAAMNDWQRHARACHARVSPAMRGRVVLDLWVEQGRVARVAVKGDASEALSDCLIVRARRLLRFPDHVTAGALVPLVFEGRG